MMRTKASSPASWMTEKITALWESVQRRFVKVTLCSKYFFT